MRQKHRARNDIAPGQINKGMQEERMHIKIKTVRQVTQLLQRDWEGKHYMYYLDVMIFNIANS